MTLGQLRLPLMTGRDWNKAEGLLNLVVSSAEECKFICVSLQLNRKKRHKRESPIWAKVRKLIKCRYSESIDIIYLTIIHRKSFAPLDWNRTILPQRNECNENAYCELRYRSGTNTLELSARSGIQWPLQGFARKWRSAWEKSYVDGISPLAVP